MADNNHLVWLAEQWAASLTSVIATMTGSEPRYEIGALETPPPDLFWQQALDLEAAATLTVQASEASWSALGTLVLNSAGIDEVLPLEARNAFLEMATQSLTELNSGLSQRLGYPVKWKPGAERDKSVEGAPVAVQLHLDNGTTLVLSMVASCEMLALFETAAMPRARDTAELTTQIAPFPKTMELLLDVELPVSISFGRTQLRIKDVLKLTTGSIVELHRAVSDPVEVIVNNCVIARGEVVVVEGNYGVRVQEIVSRNERLRTSRQVEGVGARG